MDSFSTLLYMKIIIRFLTFSVGLRNFSTTILIDSMQGIYRRKILQRIFCYKLIWNGLRQGSEGFLIIKGTSSDRLKVLWTFKLAKIWPKIEILKLFCPIQFAFGFNWFRAKKVLKIEHFCTIFEFFRFNVIMKLRFG